MLAFFYQIPCEVVGDGLAGIVADEVRHGILFGPIEFLIGDRQELVGFGEQ